ncbi:MAG: fluoride efflux transporter CrcB [Candidatus Methanoperedens sp.]|jgi:CrcB protein|nr:fluoride efflux transporter CrcB [Candidatus Methanoperedens sp.]
MKKGEFLSEFKMLILIGAGGFMGAAMRYYMSGLLTRGDFPYGTLLVNILGSFILGFLLFSSFYSGYDSPEIRGFLAIGLLGAFTTMSTFSFETLEFFNTREFWTGGVNIILNVGLSITGVYSGKVLALIMSG